VRANAGGLAACMCLLAFLMCSLAFLVCLRGC
jgi:hypothetical protein